MPRKPTYQDLERRIRGLEEECDRVKHAEEEHLSHLRVLESLERVDATIRQADSLEGLLTGVLDTALSIFESDRVWLLYPCDPEAPSWRIPMERTRPEFPGAFALGSVFPVTPEIRQQILEALNSSGPVVYDWQSKPSLLQQLNQFSVQSLIQMAVYPKKGKPWIFGMHQCSYARVWSEKDRRLFTEIARRIADGLTSLLFLKELRESEQKLQESEQMFRSIVENSQAGIFTLDNAYRFTYVNDQLSALCGYSQDELIGKDFRLLLSEESRPLTVDRYLRRQKGEELPSWYEVVAVRKDGQKRFMEYSASVVRDSAGQVKTVGQALDITERKQTEEALRFMNTVLLTQQETAPDGLLVVDGEGRMIIFNKKLVDMWNVPTEILESKSDHLALKLVLDKLAEPKEFLDLVRHLYRNPTEKSHEEIGLVDGRTFERYSAPMTGPEGRYYGRVWYFRDITERKRRETAIKESEQRYRAVVEDLPAMVCRFLSDGVLTFVNSAYCQYFEKKKEDLIGRDFFLVLPDEDREKVRHHFTSLNEETPMTTYEHQVIAPDGTIRWQEWTDRALFDERGRLVEYQSIGRDITEAKLAQEEKAKIEKQLQQAHKMEAIGTLAGGIAHDFNNILGAIIGYSDLALKDVAQEDRVHYHLEQILKGGYRARDLVKQILAFSRQTEQEQRPIKMSPLVKEVAKLLRASLPATIEIQTNIGTESDMVLADPTQIHQVIMNLCTNAGHAMRERGGILRLNLLEADLDAHSSLNSPDLREGLYLRLEVSDSGHGMSPEVLKRIFDPYFTTKEISSGTGLGLAVVHGIIKKHRGAITVHSEPGQGTSFYVFLPRAAAPSEQQEEEASSIPGGKERVLFVDDEVDLTNLAREILEFLGYTVITKTNSTAALEAYRADPDGFDIVITDQTMPTLTGLELAKELLGIRPDLPIILCTGFSEQINPEKAQALGISGFLFKPILIPDLAQSIRRALDEKHPGD